MYCCSLISSFARKKTMTQLNSHGSRWWEVMNNVNKDHLTLAIITILVLILAFSWYKFTYPSSTNGGSPLPPGPRSLPIIGYLPFLGPDLHKQFTKMSHIYGPIFKFHLGSKLHVVINTPELAKVMLRDQDETFANRRLTIGASLMSFGGRNILWSNSNADWRKLRKILVHEVLSSKNLKASSSIRRDEVRKTIKYIYSKIGTRVNISEISFSTEANVLTSMVYENTSNNESKDGDLRIELQTVVSNIVELVGQPNLSDFFPSLEYFDLQGIQRELKKQLKKLDQLFVSIIDDRIKYNSETSELRVGHDGKKDFLQVLLDLNDKKDATSVTLSQTKALLTDVMLAGTETLTTLIEWAMTTIMQNDNVMKNVQKELTEIVGLNNVVEESHLPELKYLDATIKEIFRLYPVVPLLLPRSPTNDCKVGGYTIPKGCTIFLNVWSIQRDPRYWDKPLEFNPERFLSYDGVKKWEYHGNNMLFLPFGSGRRLCPGITLAEKMQMFVLASLLHSFDWRMPKGEENHDLSEKFGLTLKKAKPLIVIPSQRLSDPCLYM